MLIEQKKEELFNQNVNKMLKTMKMKEIKQKLEK